MIYRFNTSATINSTYFEDITIDSDLNCVYATTHLNNYMSLAHWGAFKTLVKFDINVDGLKIKLMLLTYEYTTSRVNVKFSIDESPNLKKFILKKERLEKLNKLENV